MAITGPLYEYDKVVTFGILERQNYFYVGLLVGQFTNLKHCLAVVDSHFGLSPQKYQGPLAIKCCSRNVRLLVIECPDDFPVQQIPLLDFLPRYGGKLEIVLQVKHGRHDAVVCILSQLNGIETQKDDGVTAHSESMGVTHYTYTAWGRI